MFYKKYKYKFNFINSTGYSKYKSKFPEKSVRAVKLLLAAVFYHMTSVIFSTIGVIGGLSTFGIDFIVVMTGIGIISLAGIVVNNAIVPVMYRLSISIQKKIMHFTEK